MDRRVYVGVQHWERLLGGGRGEVKSGAQQTLQRSMECYSQCRKQLCKGTRAEHGHDSIMTEQMGRDSRKQWLSRGSTG